MIRVGAIVGPTAVGKTALSIEVARRLGAEIVSLDSMQAYRGMDIGTATPSLEERTSVPHHLIDVFDPSDEVTVADFRDAARAAIVDIEARGAYPLLVGGSGLYFRSVVDDLRFPPRDEAVRRKLEDEAAIDGGIELYERLRELDPAAALKIEPGNTRRIVRALEAIELTGARFSEFDSSWERYESIYDLKAVGLQRSREDLYARIHERAEAMIERGLVAETTTLAAQGLSRTAAQALGYRQVLEMQGSAPEDVLAAIVRATKRFARRQESWFRSDPRIEWIELDGDPIVERIAEHLSG